jgi:pectinesterase
MRFLLALSSILSLALAAGRTSPPAGALVVKKSPGSGQYGTVQAAVNALSTTSTTAQSIFIYAGSYKEQVLIPERKAQLSIYGETTDTSTYKSNTVTITYNKDATSAGGDDPSGTVRNKATNSRFYNINIANTYGIGSQAIALSAYAAKQGYYGVALTGYQDTLLAQTGTQVYANSMIQGHTDFIFGQHAPAWFENSDILVVATGTGYITASGRPDGNDPNYYVFNKCHIKAASGQSVAAGAYFLGRPWAEYARVVFQNSDMSNVINAAGWHIWNTGNEQTGHVTFGEYGNTGAGASGTRASFGKKLGGAVAVSTVLGSDYASWVDSAYLK